MFVTVFQDCKMTGSTFGDATMSGVSIKGELVLYLTKTPKITLIANYQVCN
ncbi:hypothetical protein [Shimazuella alba]|uniref:Uncharacterized protein n=1 Tax=Shimazuella alba TaxID=2690964 RepID=A0A6I4VTS5_9BACL|nr:hypothetical protein [Shimazuella alba]MXQ53911.1 hypothetical protein [Shimazuella alba]